MLRVPGRAAGVVLVVMTCLGLSACEDKPKEVPPQFRPSMATTPAPSRPVVALPPTAVRKPVDLESYKDAKAPVVPLVPGKPICRECDLHRKKARLQNAKRMLRPRQKRPVKSKYGRKKG